MNLQTRFPNTLDPLTAQLAIISLLLAMTVLRLRGGRLHCQGAPLICYSSQGYGASRLTGPWRHKPRPPWRLSANPDAWHGPNRPMGAVQEPWMAMICFHRGQFQSCGISMDERNVFLWGWTELEQVKLLLSHITPSHSRSKKVSIIKMSMNLGQKLLGFWENNPI